MIELIDTGVRAGQDLTIGGGGGEGALHLPPALQLPIPPPLGAFLGGGRCNPNERHMASLTTYFLSADRPPTVSLGVHVLGV